MRKLIAASAALLVAAGCSSYLIDPTSGASGKATLEPTKGNAAAGTITFTRIGDRVKVAGTITGLKPGGEHGFHVHEKGDCSSGDGMSAGGHFNPMKHPHGGNGPYESRHAGDMPNIKADASGTATFSFEVSGLSIGSLETDILGKGLSSIAIPTTTSRSRQATPARGSRAQ